MKADSKINKNFVDNKLSYYNLNLKINHEITFLAKKYRQEQKLLLTSLNS